MKKKPALEIGRLGSKAFLELTHRRAGSMGDRRTKRARTRSAQRREAIEASR